MRTVKPIPCAWNDLVLPITSIQDELGRSWIERRYPGRDASDFEDGGRLPAAFQVSAIFVGPRWKSTLEAFRGAVEGVPDSVAGTFTHPFWGRLDGVILGLQITHETDRHDCARATFTFREGTVSGVAFELANTLASATSAATAAIDETIAALAALEAG